MLTVRFLGSEFVKPHSLRRRAITLPDTPKKTPETRLNNPQGRLFDDGVKRMEPRIFCLGDSHSRPHRSQNSAGWRRKNRRCSDKDERDKCISKSGRKATAAGGHGKPKRHGHDQLDGSVSIH
jgi:hypothetical protein